MSLWSDEPGTRLARVPASSDFQRALGAAVRDRRLELGLTQEPQSLRAALHQRWISNVETGVRNPSYASLRRLAEGLDLTTSELIRRAEANDPLAGPGP
jgi:transcriptional regulator with XRE-family HTH domain